MKNFHAKLLAALLFIGLATGFISQGKFDDTISRIPINDTMNDLLASLASYQEKLPSESVYLHFDRTFFKPGETIWFQAYIRNTKDMKPAGSEIVHIEIINPKGAVAQEFSLVASNGVASGDWLIDEDLAGGLYKVKAYTQWQKNEPNPQFFEKEITVQRVVLPRLKMKLDFEQKAYGPEDEVSATVIFESLENKPLASQEVVATAMLQGKNISSSTLKTNDKGEVTVKFNLPKSLKTADGLLQVKMQYQGQWESISRSIPIALENIQLSFFPEGGDAVVGLTNRMAFKAVNEFGKPADVSGKILNKQGEEVATFTSFHDGMGAFDFEPKKGERYHAQITKPSSMSKERFDLPEALPQGYSLQVTQGAGGKLKLSVTATQPDKLLIVGQVRGEVYYSEAVQLWANKSVEIPVPTDKFPMGVAQFTLFDGNSIERAERLAFVNADRKLNLEITTDKDEYLPREKVTVTIRATDDKGMPMPAQLSLAVADDKLLSFADDRQGHILSQLLLEQDLTGKVYEPTYYFDYEEIDAWQVQKALDYLLMTQGWRRFTWEQIVEGKPAIKHTMEKAVIAGTVIGTDGKPVANAKVNAGELKLTTGEDGRFSIEGHLLYDPLVISASDDARGEGSVTVSEYSQSLSINLRIPYIKKRLYQMQMNAAGGVLRGAPERALQVDAEPAMWDDADFGEGAEAEDDWGGEEPIVVVAEGRALNNALAPRDLPKEKKDMNQEMEQQVMDWRTQAKNEKPVAVATKYYRARVFAVPNYEGQTTAPATRSDFRNTVFWEGNIVIDRRGKAEISFYNSDALTSFRITAEGIAANGQIGRVTHTYFTQLPFGMDAKVPTVVSMGDVVKVPVALSNNTKILIKGELTVVSPDSWASLDKERLSVNIPAGSAETLYLPYQIASSVGKDKLSISFKSAQGEDAFEQMVEIVPKGFPVILSKSGQELKDEFTFDIQAPVEGTMTASVTAYPTSLSDMLSGIESILREPHGCFEQTSSSTYPNIMVMQYLEAADIEDATVAAKATALVDKGYKKLVSFETPEKGYEWFGGAPAHEALTAYGLMEFIDMKQVYGAVDQQMVDRTAKWLMARKDGKGGFGRNARALDSFGRADDDVTNAYIVYSLSEAGFIQEIKEELEAAYKAANDSKDPYTMALVSNALFNTKDARAEKILASLNALQQEDGRFEGKRHSVTRSTGVGLKVETTSLAVLANLKADKLSPLVIDNAVKFIIESRSGNGGFGNTQSTVMALKALTAFAQYAKRTAESGDLVVWVDGKKVATQHFEAGHQGAIEVLGLEQYLAKGSHTIKMAFEGMKEALPYTASIHYSTSLPQSHASCAVQLQTSLDKKKVTMGSTVRLTATLHNTQEEGQPMTMAILGIPAGLQPQPWQLKELQEKGEFAYYEVLGNDIAIYYRDLAPKAEKTINLDLQALIPGEYEGAASSAYLYYTNELKNWQEGLKVTVSK